MNGKTKIVAEAGINHNGSVDLAKELVSSAYVSGCDYVKFQKRTPEVCVPEDQKTKSRWTPRQGEVDYIDYKKEIEFSGEEMVEIVDYANDLGIGCFASVWDKQSSDLMSDLSDIGKIPSPMITNTELLEKARSDFDLLIVSTGMSTEAEIERAVDISNPDVIMHSVSSYPTPVEDIRMRYVKHLENKFGDQCEVGYSGHERQIYTASAAVAVGSEWIERHLTLGKNMWGSDHSASLNPDEFSRMVASIRTTENALGDEEIEDPSFRKELIGSEKAKKESLRKDE